MLELISNQVLKEIAAISKKAHRRRAAVAYVSDDSIIKFTKGDTLVVDASDEKVKAGNTDAKVLRRAFDRGAHLWSCKGLHAKIVVFGHDYAVVGSANISNASHKSLIEGAVCTDDPILVPAAVDFIEAVTHASDKIDEAFLCRIEKLPVARANRRDHKHNRNRKNISTRQPQHWIVGYAEDHKHPGDPKKVEARRAKVEKRHARPGEEGVQSIWFYTSKLSSMKIKPKRGDLIIAICRIRRSDSISKASVYQHARLCDVDKRLAPKVTTFHIAWRNNSEDTCLKWNEFESIAKGAGISGGLKATVLFKNISKEQSGQLNDRWKSCRPSGHAT